jgi:resuscitation-promoting factor RpfB
VLVLVVSGGVSAAMLSGAPRTAAVVAGPATTAAPSPTASVAPSPSPTMRDEVVTEAIPFEKQTVEDSGRPQGENQVTVAGVNGEKKRTFRVTILNGAETGRQLISEQITRAPVTEVTSVGTYVAPAAPPPPAVEEPAEPDPPADSSDGCDPNYADGCVPIDSDVDCGGGSGNGPSYFYGTARVVGTDIYKLDADHDGIACEK